MMKLYQSGATPKRPRPGRPDIIGLGELEVDAFTHAVREVLVGAPVGDF
jgi:hypothetical protein